MSESPLTEEQKSKIYEIREQWANEMCRLFDKWDEEERLLREKNSNAPRILDKHAKEIAAIERKYREMISDCEKSV